VNKSQRSVDRKMSVVSPPSLLKGIRNTDLLQKLTKLYTRFVQSDDTTSKHKDIKRLTKIRSYLIHKFKPKNKSGTYTLQQVEKGKELEYLYKFWQTTLKKKNLNVKYLISYKHSSSQNDKETLSEFLTMASKQIKDKYFDVIPNSHRYTLKSAVCIDEANFLGQLMGMFIICEVHIPFHLSFMLLGHIMFVEKHISFEELFLYYILDLYKSESKNRLEVCEASTTDACVPKKVIQEHVEEIYNYQKKFFKTFVRMFIFDKKIFNTSFYSIHDKIRLYDLDNLLTKTIDIR
jgi:hypothetical protein